MEGGEGKGEQLTPPYRPTTGTFTTTSWPVTVQVSVRGAAHLSHLFKQTATCFVRVSACCTYIYAGTLHTHSKAIGAKTHENGGNAACRLSLVLVGGWAVFSHVVTAARGTSNSFVAKFTSVCAGCLGEPLVASCATSGCLYTIA